MKKDIHPGYHEIKVVMTDGSAFQTRSTWGKPGDSLKLDVDRLTHPAWIQGARKLVDSGGRIARFQKRFSGLKLGDTALSSKSPKQPPTENKREGESPQSEGQREPKREKTEATTDSGKPS